MSEEPTRRVLPTVVAFDQWLRHGKTQPQWFGQLCHSKLKNVPIELYALY